MTKESFIERELFALNHKYLPLLFLFGATVDVALCLLDFAVTPENFQKFLIIRSATALVTLMLAGFVKLHTDSRYDNAALLFATFLTASMIEAMVMSFGGHQSTYYAGMILLMIFVFAFLPISVRMTVVINSIIYAIYLVPILLFDHISNVRIFINNNAFLMAAFSGSIAWRHINYKLLTYNLSLQYDLEQQKKQLEVYSLQLKDMVEERTRDLRKSEQWHRSLVDNATDGIIVLDRTGLIVNVNDRASEMHGFSREALMGAHIRILEANSRQEETADRMRRLLEGEALVFESAHHKKDGTLLHLEISSKAITIDDDVFIQSFYRDVSEKKKLQGHLFQSQKMESIGVLAGGIAHDFNNILTAILGHSEIIRRSSLEEKAVRSLNVIEEAARRAGRMISKLLGFARKSNYEIVPLNLNDIIFDSVKLLERVIDRKISLTVELDNHLPLIQGDVNQMEQVIMNLIVNARDAMPNGGRIVIKTIPRQVIKGMPEVPPYVPEGEYVQLSVADTGNGIPKELVDKIFEPFFTTKERGKGTGLGLSMVYGAVKEHRGYISVQSKPGAGAVFTIYLPASQKADVVLKKKQLPAVRGSETVLIVDDEQEILDSVQDALTAHGYKVFAMGDPASAVALFSKLSGEISLVITDIVMPRINGKELISRIKAINSDVKILAISGYTKYVAPKEEIGDINGFLQKPFESYYLLSVIRRILDATPHDVFRNN